MKTLKSRALVNALVMISLTTGCGKGSDHSTEPAAHQGYPVESGLPEAAVIAVPLDENGQELAQEADLRLIPKSRENLAGEAIQSAYVNGKRPDRILDEMDMTTSTESFQGWSNYRFTGQRGIGFGYNQYQPIYFHGGNPYSWRFLNQHRCRSVNYYYYHRRPQHWATPWNQPRPLGYEYGRHGQYGQYGRHGQIQPIGYY